MSFGLDSVFFNWSSLPLNGGYFFCDHWYRFVFCCLCCLLEWIGVISLFLLFTLSIYYFISISSWLLVRHQQFYYLFFGFYICKEPRSGSGLKLLEVIVLIPCFCSMWVGWDRRLGQRRTWHFHNDLSFASSSSKITKKNNIFLNCIEKMLMVVLNFTHLHE